MLFRSINDEFFLNIDVPVQKNSGIKPDMIYDDTNISVLFKKTGLLCHSDITGDPNLVDIYVDYLKSTGEYIPSAGRPFTPSICNRLDRGTSGLVLAAKNYKALRDGAAIIRDGLLTKEYLCIVLNKPPEGKKIAYLSHDDKKKKSYVFKNPADGRKQIITGIKVLQSKNNISLCNITLYTGRTHQIRAHLSHLGCPLLGDKKYGNAAANEMYSDIKNQALSAYHIKFADIPSTNTLSYLGGRSYKLDSPEIIDIFSRL